MNLLVCFFCVYTCMHCMCVCVCVCVCVYSYRDSHIHVYTYAWIQVVLNTVSSYRERKLIHCEGESFVFAVVIGSASTEHALDDAGHSEVEEQADVQVDPEV